MFYIDEGTGDPTFVFVHGFCCCHEDWELQRAHFRRTSRVVVCDLRGHGRSDQCGESWTIDECANDVVRLLEELNIDDVVLVGHSMGCRVILRCYLDAPHRVRALVFVDPSYVAEGSDPTSFEVAREEPLSEVPWDTFIRRTFDQMFVPTSPRLSRERILDQALRTREEVGRGLAEEFFLWDARNMTSALSQVRVPVLSLQSTVVHGVRRPMRDGERTPWIKLLGRYLPEATIEVIPDVGHFSMLEAPEVVNNAITSFVRKTGPG
jgi:pimeloyl-ACP methyl ester carboxylesterase